jgi:hypothetical protein
MPDHPIRGSDLRTPAPTLEPDDAFVAQLSSLAAAGANAPQGEAPAPPATWRVGLAAASVAAVLVGVAWLAGLDPTGSPDPAPPPATTPTAPEDTSSSAARSSDPDRAAEPASTSSPALGAVPPNSQSELPEHPGRPDQGAAEQVEPANGSSKGNGPDASTGNGTGPDQHAGDHPDEHATTKSNNASPRAGDKPGRADERPGGRWGR